MNRAEPLHLQARLRSLMEHAIAHVPYYRNWARQHVSRPLAAAALPLADCDEGVISILLYKAFQSEALSVRDMSPAKPSGSSGEPFLLRVHHWSTDYSYA